MVLAVTFLASLLLVTAAKPMGRRAMVVHETRAEPARGFVNSGIAPAAKELTLRIALKPNNIAGLETALYAVSDPVSALYGQHLTPEEVCLVALVVIQTLDSSCIIGRRIRQAYRRDALHRGRVVIGEWHLLEAGHSRGRYARDCHPRGQGQRAPLHRLLDLHARRVRPDQHPHTGVLHPRSAAGPHRLLSPHD